MRVWEGCVCVRVQFIAVATSQVEVAVLICVICDKSALPLIDRH